MRRIRTIGLVGCVAGMLGACGGDEPADPPAPTVGSGVVTEPWEAYCTATFTADYEVTDEFFGLGLTARAGDTYLLGSRPSFTGRVELLYLTPDGPLAFDVEGDPAPLEYTCGDASEMTVGVFADTELFEDEQLDRKACDLPAGTAMATSEFGYSISDASAEDLFGDEPPVYEITLGALGERCGGRTTAFAKAKNVRWKDEIFSVLPFETFEGPVAPVE